MQRPDNPFNSATAITIPLAADGAFDGIDDEGTVRLLKYLEAHAFNVVRAGNELAWSIDGAWKAYRMSHFDLSDKSGLRPSDQLQVYWWSFVNYTYQFQEKIKLFVNNFNSFASAFEYAEIPDAGKFIKKHSKRLDGFTRFRHAAIHEWHYPPEEIGQLPLAEHIQENQNLYRHFGADYSGIPRKALFRITRSGMHSRMEDGIRTMIEVRASLTEPCRLNILRACYRVSSYVQWAKAGQVRIGRQ